MLNVYLHESHNSQVALWSRSGDQGEQWRPGRATVISPLSPYQVHTMLYHIIWLNSTIEAYLKTEYMENNSLLFIVSFIMICLNGITLNRLDCCNQNCTDLLYELYLIISNKVISKQYTME